MRILQELINKPIISIKEGKQLGKAQDFFVDQALTNLTAIYLGSESLFDRNEMLIKWSDVVTLGEDKILVEDADCVLEVPKVLDPENYVRRNDMSGWQVDTPGGTNIGIIGDIIIDGEGRIVGFSLPQTFVSGPIADNKAVSRSAVLDIGGKDGILTADLADAENANLQISYEGLFAEPVVSSTDLP